MIGLSSDDTGSFPKKRGHDTNVVSFFSTTKNYALVIIDTDCNFASEGLVGKYSMFESKPNEKGNNANLYQNLIKLYYRPIISHCSLTWVGGCDMINKEDERKKNSDTKCISSKLFFVLTFNFTEKVSLLACTVHMKFL